MPGVGWDVGTVGECGIGAELLDGHLAYPGSRNSNSKGMLTQAYDGTKARISTAA